CSWPPNLHRCRWTGCPASSRQGCPRRTTSELEARAGRNPGRQRRCCRRQERLRATLPYPASMQTCVLLKSDGSGIESTAAEQASGSRGRMADAGRGRDLGQQDGNFEIDPCPPDLSTSQIVDDAEGDPDLLPRGLPAGEFAGVPPDEQRFQHRVLRLAYQRSELGPGVECHAVHLLEHCPHGIPADVLLPGGHRDEDHVIGEHTEVGMAGFEVSGQRGPGGVGGHGSTRYNSWVRGSTRRSRQAATIPSPPAATAAWICS